jgi:tRNA-specific 2-thiouridylase
MSTKKAIALLSGGLDSLLATKVILEQGIEVLGVNFFTGFCVEGHTHAIRNKHKEKKKRNNALWAAETLGIKLEIVDVVEEYKDIVLNPKHGYGANLNPCLDCKIFMVKKAVEWLDNSELAYDFIITGEVIGQRPKSQRKATMPVIATLSGAEDRLLRPLCAKNLPPTLPERMGWVDREKLYGFSGRSRKPQIELAAQFGFENYAQPAGGCCFLTDQRYSKKLQDLWQAQGERRYELDDIMLLKIGRHIRPKPHFKLIVGRDEGENNFLQGYTNQFIALQSLSHNGPLVLIDGTPSAEDITLAARVTARYSQQVQPSEIVEIGIYFPNGEKSRQTVRPLLPADIDAWYV